MCKWGSVNNGSGISLLQAFLSISLCLHSSSGQNVREPIQLSCVWALSPTDHDSCDRKYSFHSATCTELAKNVQRIGLY